MFEVCQYLICFMLLVSVVFAGVCGLWVLLGDIPLRVRRWREKGAFNFFLCDFTYMSFYTKSLFQKTYERA